MYRTNAKILLLPLQEHTHTPPSFPPTRSGLSWLFLLQQARQLKRRRQDHQSYVPCQDYFQLYIVIFVTQQTPPLKSPTSKFSCGSVGNGALGRKQVSNSVFYAQLTSFDF